MIPNVIHYVNASAAVYRYDVLHSNFLYYGAKFNPIAYTTGKDLYVSDNDWNKPHRMIESNSWVHISANNAPKLFISSACKLPRDLVRNSGYQITRDKDKADFIIIPNCNAAKIATYKYNLAFKRDGSDDINLIVINRTDGGNKFSEDDVNIILNNVKDNEGDVEFFYRNNLEPFYCSFLPKCDEYVEIYENILSNKSTLKYVRDNMMQLTGSNTISIETLEVWSRIGDRQVLEKSVINSDWSKYPCTMAVFLAAEQSIYCNYASGQWKWLLNQIEYSKFDTYRSLDDRVITPEDWNMLQKWIMYKLGLPENGGYLNLNISNIDPNYRPFIRTRVCCMPYKISEEMTFDNIAAAAQNS
jgi:hypothetical protein